MFNETWKQQWKTSWNVYGIWMVQYMYMYIYIPSASTTIKRMVCPISMIFQPFSNGGYINPPIVLMVGFESQGIYIYMSSTDLEGCENFSRGRWAPKPNAGPHKLRECLPLIVGIPVQDSGEKSTIFSTGVTWENRDPKDWQVASLLVMQGYSNFLGLFRVIMANPELVGWLL